MKIDKKYILISIFLLVLFMCRSLYLDSESKYKIKFDTIDNGIEYQIFYKTENIPKFEEQHSVKYMSNGDDIDFKHNEIDIRTDETITTLRIDLGRKPETIKIKNLVIEGENVYKVTSQEIINGLNENIDEYNVTNDFLEIKSTQNDPFFVINNEMIKPKQGYAINYFLLITISIIIYIVLSIIFYIIDKLKGEIGVKKATFIFIVLAIIATPIFFMNKDEIDIIENRTLAKFPALYKESTT